MGVTNTIRHFQKEFTERPLKESTVRTWLNKYKKEITERRKCGNDEEMKRLPSKTRGHPLLLGNHLDNQVKEYVKSLREAGAVINSAIVMAVAEGIIKNHDLLECNDGHILLTKNWAKVYYIVWDMVSGEPAQRQKFLCQNLQLTRLSLLLM